MYRRKYPININIQRDVHKFFLNFIDEFENRQENTDNENIIKYFFQGKVIDNIYFKKFCKHKKFKINTFYSIELEIKNSIGICNALKS